MANNSETVGHKDLRLGPIVYIIVFYNISFSWLLPLDGFQFNFLLRDSENDLYDGHLELVPAFLYSLYLAPYKTDNSLRRTLTAGPKGVQFKQS